MKKLFSKTLHTRKKEFSHDTTYESSELPFPLGKIFISYELPNVHCIHKLYSLTLINIFLDKFHSFKTRSASHKVYVKKEASYSPL